MSDRKYRQHGYQDADRDRRSSPGGQRQGPGARPPAKYDPRLPRDPRTPNLPGFRDVFRCARCGRVQAPEIAGDSQCAKCGVDLHACVHCASFDAGATFECRQTIPARVSPKDARNTCSLFSARVSVERETGSTPAAGASGARQAFDDLFKF
jgi:hypothetical protein